MSGSLYGRLLRRYRLGNDAPNRREMLKRTLAASAGMLLSCQVGPFSSLGADAASRKRIVLVGAGFAGLACAYELSAAGYNVKLLEARNRCGGQCSASAILSPGKTSKAAAN